MNSRRRRGVLLLVLSLVCALAAFAGVLAVVRNVEAEVGDEVTAYRLKEDVPAYEKLDASQLERISMPRRWLPGTAVTDPGQIRRRIAANALQKGSLLQSDMMAKRPELAEGEQELAIMIDAETGVAGKIDPGNRVNIYATFEGERRPEGTGRDDRGGGGSGTPSESRLIVSRAKVIDVGKLTPLDDDGDRDERTRREEREGVPITFALSTGNAQRVAYAESFAENVRLALVAPGDDTRAPEKDRIYTLPGDE